MSIFGNMAPVWTYSLFKVIPPTSFWMTPRLLVVSWAPVGPPVVFQPWDMPCPSVLVDANLVDNVNDTCLQVDPAGTFSFRAVLVLSLFIPFCIVLWPFSAVVFCWGTMFHSHVITGSMHSLYTFIFNLSGMLLFHIMSPACQKWSNQGLFCISTPVLDRDIFSPSDWGRCSCQIFRTSFHWLHITLSLFQMHIKTSWSDGFMDVLYHLLQLWDWFSAQNYVIYKDEVGQVFTINLDTSVFLVDLANDSIL